MILEFLHPLAIANSVRNVDHDPDQIVAVEIARVAPVAFHLLCLVTSRPEVRDNLVLCYFLILG